MSKRKDFACTATGIWEWPGMFGRGTYRDKCPDHIVVSRIDTDHPWRICEYCNRRPTYMIEEHPFSARRYLYFCSHHVPRLLREEPRG